ncbi:DEAD/DEAH box helicase family protein [Candidatus Marinimicrobia bacterium]|nr:DEAD/DEAH box helicase family protein [Candidatus Neomarinimicrobiota bacterium]
MSEFLHDTILEEFGKREIAKLVIPSSISDNLKKDFIVRAYQEEAFKRFFLFYNEDFDAKQNKPYHLLYNMATGSGKTLVMAGLMLYLYEKGYRNFLFFVNSTNIIDKTKDNFLNSSATKYLFDEKIMIGGKEILIKEVDNFESADIENINIKFTTIQQLHLDLTNTKENSITIEDFKNQKTVLLADEIHHLNASTSYQTSIDGTWEGTSQEILEQNNDNILLGFTATINTNNANVISKYTDKSLFKYDLKQFRLDKYSKEINLIRSDFEVEGRILQALILNTYREVLATTKYNINLKPVILFKAKRTIAESEQHKVDFHHLIDNLNINKIDKIKNTSSVSVVQKAFSFFDVNNITSAHLVEMIQQNFKFGNCLSANNDKEKEVNQIRLNTLEDENNPIRAIFAVHKLNEGWDVLNLFDIVRLYEGQNTGGSNKTFGKATIAEAQLIGRGARYYPFKITEDQGKFRRKYDNDHTNDLKVLEELYYHAREDSRYIFEIKKALIESGIYEDETNLIEKKLQLKLAFKTTNLYKTGKIYENSREIKSYNHVFSFSDLGVSKTNYTINLASGGGDIISIFDEIATTSSSIDGTPIDVSLKDIPKHLIRYATSQNPFFHYSNINKYLPHMNSISNFISSDDYLGGLSIRFKGKDSRLENISTDDYLFAIQGLLTDIESDIKNLSVSYQSTAFFPKYIHEVFEYEKIIRVNKDDERADGQEDFIKNKDWYVYNANYGTSEEKQLVEMFAARFDSINSKYEDVYLIRNERVVKIYDKDGRRFEPDFILFVKEKNVKQPITYQIFIEPKGNHLMQADKWKEDFLEELRVAKLTLEIDSDKYLITGVPFYNYDNENEIIHSLENKILSINN